MDFTVGTMLFWTFIVGVLIGVPVGYFVARAGESRRTHERIAAENQRRADEIATKRKHLHDAGRRLPAQPGAGAPIRIGRVKYSRKP